MVFSSLTFLSCALPIALAVYFLVPRALKNAWLLLFSLVFYAWGEPVYVLLMLFSISVNWLCACLMEKRSQNLRRALMIAAALIDLGLLAAFKYAGFLAEIVQSATGLPFSAPDIPLPIGISFYTFQALSYVIDVYRGDVPIQRRWSHVALYVSLFPQLIAGPIVRYSDVAAQIEDRTETWDGFALGMRRFVLGLGKKVLIANMVAPVADEAFAMASLSAGGAWMGVIAYAVQIYFDFSGYSDMAIGLGRMFGFAYMENFRYPYIARSIKEFWNRWHISLSTWFRDYLYIPLGGSRVGKGRQALNIMLVFALTGLWHGASWTFVVWGLMHGAFRALEALLPGRERRGVGALVYTWLVVLAGWVLFRADDLPHAFHYLSAMVGGGAGGWLTSLTPRAWLSLGLGLIGATPLPAHLSSRLPAPLESVLSAVGTLLILALSILALASSTYNPFIYFRF